MGNEPHVRNIADAELTAEIALPAAPGAVNSGSVDLGQGPHVAGAELRVQAPALTTAELPDAETVTYALESSTDDAVFNAVCDAGVQTGAGGNGADAVDFRFTPPSTGERYWRVVATSSGGAGDQSGKNTALQVVV